MTENKLVPKRRFKEFKNTDAWEQNKLIKLLSEPVTDGPHETPNIVGSGIPFISVDAIINNKIDFTRKRGYISEKTNELYSKKYKPQLHDVYLVKSGSTVGKTAIVETDELFNIWSPLAAMRTGDISYPYYLYYLLQTKKLQNQVKDKASNGTQPNLGMRELEKFNVQFPKIEEQKKIGSFFKQLDSTIALHQRKLEKMKSLKTAYLSEMFPAVGEKKPKRRFKGFTDDWELRKLGKLGSVAMNKRIFKEETSDDGEIPFYKIGTFGGKPDAFISRELFELYKLKYPYPEIGDLLISASGSIGRVVEYTGADEYFQDSNIVWLKHDNRIVKSFLKQFYNIVKWQGLEGSTIKRLYNKNILETEIIFPKPDEQFKIGNFFKQLDDTIALHQHKLEKLQNLKKAYLNEMFV
ncbi:restriction endonuclease subunit S [Enterococcus sp. UD-01]|jgi:type I restriction enzyme S subunit|uniref:restriction endonuclease subunit S n=1 Tax=Enterococcus sp. UD-01 TaxID=3373911 RepID=UPI0038340229